MQMKKQQGIKKILAGICVAAASAVILMPSPAFANNHKDQDWSFYTSYGGSGYLSDADDKQDASSVYIKCTSSSVGGTSFIAVPYGAKKKTGTYSNMAYMKNGISYSAAKHTIKSGTEKKMISYIYEAGGRYAKIHYDTTSGHVTFKGKWSPDSI